MSNTPRTDAAYDAVRAFTNEEQAVDALIELRETSRKLERENAALRELTSTLGAPNHINTPVETWRELREDKERLDFLGQTKCAYYYEGPRCWRINEDKNTDGDTLRDAIDAARKEAQT